MAPSGFDAMVPDRPFLTPTEVAEILALRNGAQGIYELARGRSSDPLPVLRVGKYLRVPRAEFVAWLERRRVRPDPQLGAAKSGAAQVPDACPDDVAAPPRPNVPFLGLC